MQCPDVISQISINKIIVEHLFVSIVQLKDTDVFAGAVIDTGWTVNTPKNNQILI